jgi:hypothetical protein
MAMDIIMESPSELIPGDEVGTLSRLSYRVLESPEAFGVGYRVKVQFVDGGITYREWDHNDPVVPVRAESL